ncbi:MAG TPA: hypothetical protein PLB32_19090, partial [Acidobacteriota bacterium]|nr:hypothetical protein [Acidobacteriota bacterium]
FFIQRGTMAANFDQPLAELKRKVQTAQNLKEPWEYFFDHLGEKDEFLAAGKEIQHPFLESVLQEVGKAILQTEPKPTQTLLIQMTNQPFIHGASWISGRLFNILFFPDDQIGMIAVASPWDMKNVTFARFSCTEVDGEQRLLLEPLTSSSTQ